MRYGVDLDLWIDRTHRRVDSLDQRHPHRLAQRHACDGAIVLNTKEDAATHRVEKCRQISANLALDGLHRIGSLSIRVHHVERRCSA